MPIVRKLPRGSTVCLNVETGKYGQDFWNVLQVGGVHVNQAAVANRIRLIDWLRDYNPGCRYGYYAQVPPKYEGLVTHSFETWRRQAKDLKPLAEAADFLLCEVYADSDWSEEFACRYILHTASTCRHYYPDKPVYFLLWPEHADLYGQSSADYTIENHRTRLIPPRYWRAMLEHCYMLGDGVMLWGGYKVPWNGGPWWEETEDFLIRRGVAPIKRLEE